MGLSQRIPPKNYLQNFCFPCLWPSVAMLDHLSPLEVSGIWANRQRRMQVLLEFAKEVNSRVKSLRCRCSTSTLVFYHSNALWLSGSSTISTYLPLTIKFIISKKDHVMASATGCTDDGTAANRR